MISEGLGNNQSVVTLVRGGWAGAQRYGALLWSGDIDSSFEAFRNQVNTGLNVGLAGLPWWTTDIGGFHGGDPKDPEFRELLVRGSNMQHFRLFYECMVIAYHTANHYLIMEEDQWLPELK